MEDVVLAQFQLSRRSGRPPRSRPMDEYVRKPLKIVRCKEASVSLAGYEKATIQKRASRHKYSFADWVARTQFEDALVRELTSAPTTVKSVEAKFRELADDWSKATMHISSASDLINDRHYQDIINLGWDVVPYLLSDLEQNKRFWFPALAAITGVRPFDPGDSSNPRRMTEAWVRWGKRKGLIPSDKSPSFRIKIR